jgi:N6-adenosine-specific RNA methylase IME4
MAVDDAGARRALTALSRVPPEALPNRIITASDATVAARIIRREARREARFKRLRDPGSLRGLGEGRYVVLLVDPPWRYARASDATRQAEEHYPTMSHEELLQLPVGEIAARSAILFLWATAPKLSEAVELITAWGFTYKTSAVWCKDMQGALGLGSYFRIAHEHLLLATRGNVPPPAPERRRGSVIKAARREHSAKPAIVREYIETMYPDLARIEIFARGHVPAGWDGWGLEAGASASA